LLVNFGDNVPHDCNLKEGVAAGTWSTGNDPGPDEIMDTDDDLDLQSVLATMNSSDITLIEGHTTFANNNYWIYWTGITGGSVHIIGSSNFVDNVINATISELSNLKVYNLTLEVTTPGYESWLTSVDPLFYDEVITGTSVTFNETICVPIDAPSGLYIFNVSAVDEDGVNYGNQTNEILVNSPPNTPNNPNPTNGITNVDLNADLSWNCSDPDNDSLTYDVYFGTNSSPPKVFSNQSNSSYDLSLGYETTYYWRIIAWDSYNASNSSVIWSFTTKSSPPPPPPPPSSKKDPTADAGGPYYGFVDEEIEFDGTDSKDNDESGKSIERYDWKFFDGDVWHEDLGANPTHTYNATGDYTVTLKVTDDEGKTDTDEVTVTIAIANNPLTIITAEGATTGDADIEYIYTVNSTDFDSNDTVIYTFDWGDETNTMSSVLPRNTSFNTTHSWSKYGIYTVTINAEDGSGSLDSETITVYIDVLLIDGEIKGYLADENSNNEYDSFNNTNTGEQTDVELENNTYLMDSNGDGDWDHAYNSDTGLSTYEDYVYDKYYKVFQAELSTPGFELIVLLAAIAMSLIIIKRRK